MKIIIVINRCEEEDCEMEEAGLTVLTKIASEASLRYAIQVINRRPNADLLQNFCARVELIGWDLLIFRVSTDH